MKGVKNRAQNIPFPLVLTFCNTHCPQNWLRSPCVTLVQRFDNTLSCQHGWNTLQPPDSTHRGWKLTKIFSAIRLENAKKYGPMLKCVNIYMYYQVYIRYISIDFSWPYIWHSHGMRLPYSCFYSESAYLRFNGQLGINNQHSALKFKCSRLSNSQKPWMIFETLCEWIKIHNR